MGNWLKEEQKFTKDNAWEYYKLTTNWSEIQEIPENMKWYYCNLSQLIILQGTIEEDEIKTLSQPSRAGLEAWLLKRHLIPSYYFLDQTIEGDREILAQFIKEM